MGLLLRQLGKRRSPNDRRLRFFSAGSLFLIQLSGLPHESWGSPLGTPDIAQH